MSGSAVSGLVQAANVLDTDLIVIVREPGVQGGNRRISAAALAAYIIAQVETINMPSGSTGTSYSINQEDIEDLGDLLASVPANNTIVR